MVQSVAPQLSALLVVETNKRTFSSNMNATFCGGYMYMIAEIRPLVPKVV